MPIREIGPSLVGVINEKAPPFSTGLSVRKERLGDPSGSGRKGTGESFRTKVIRRCQDRSRQPDLLVALARDPTLRFARRADASGDLLPPSPPAEKATARQDQAGQSGTGDGAGDGSNRVNI
jgi:hypothetical protein